MMRNKITKLFLTVFFSVLIFACFGVSSYAETFTGSIKNVPKSNSLKFSFSFTLKQQYNVTVKDPAGNSYNMTEDAKVIEVAVANASEGTYSYTIEAKDTDFTYNVSVIDAGKTIASVGESNPTISETVTDFRIWFEDGDLCAKWNYNGKVKITITDPARFNNLESGLTLSTNEYRRSIPSNVETLQFYIVPATDAKINGAGLTYTRTVVSKIAATVSFPQTPVVNVDSIELPISVNTSGLRLKIYSGNYVPGTNNHNDSTITPIVDEEVSIGEYSINIPLVSTSNQIVCCFIDENDNAVTQSYIYTRDMVSPTIDPKKLSLDNKSIYTNYSTTANEVVISGIITDEIATDVLGTITDFYINEFPVTVDNSGKFSYTQPLTLGTNNITLKAVDMSGNTSELTITVMMVEASGISFIKIMYLLFGIIVIVLLVLIIIKNLVGKKGENPEPVKEEKTEKSSEQNEKVNPTPAVAVKPEQQKEVKSGVSIEDKRNAEIARLTAWKNQK